MIVVDTNVVSEMMRLAPDARVVRWYRSTRRQAMFTTTITVAETIAGIKALPEGRRRAGMELDARATFAEDFGGRILPFDLMAAECYAQITSDRRAIGRLIKPLDAQIAAIARAHDMSVATRNTNDFEDCGIGVIDPWDD